MYFIKIYLPCLELNFGSFLIGVDPRKPNTCTTRKTCSRIIFQEHHSVIHIGTDHDYYWRLVGPDLLKLYARVILQQANGWNDKSIMSPRHFENFTQWAGRVQSNPHLARDWIILLTYRLDIVAPIHCPRSSSNIHVCCCCFLRLVFKYECTLIHKFPYKYNKMLNLS